MKNDPDSEARPVYHSPSRHPRLKKSSWWRCFFAAVGMSLVALAIAWSVAAYNIGVPIPMAGSTARGPGEALMALFFCLLLLPSLPLALCFVSAIAAGIGISRYLAEPASACRSAALWAFSATLVIGGLGLPALVHYLKSS